jgi:hypothetical protein
MTALLTILFSLVYAETYQHIAVQFDDRYDQRYSKEFVSVPLYPGRAVLAENEKSDDISTPFLSDHDEKV